MFISLLHDIYLKDVFSSSALSFPRNWKHKKTNQLTFNEINKNRWWNTRQLHFSYTYKQFFAYIWNLEPPTAFLTYVISVRNFIYCNKYIRWIEAYKKKCINKCMSCHSISILINNFFSFSCETRTWEKRQ